MALRLTLDIFSGRPNPVVVIDGPEERELLRRLGVGPGQKRPSAKKSAGTPEVLGYRGVVIESLQRSGKPGRAEAPVPMRLAGGSLYASGRVFESLDPNAEEFLCGSTGPFRLAGFDPDFFDFCPDEILRLRDLLKRWPWKGFPWPRPTPCRCAPLWEPAWWNDAGQVQYNNNCYNYASDYRSDTYAQPGLAANAQYQQINCAQVKAGAVADMLIDSPGANNKCPAEGHLVALVVGPNIDFHWYRKSRNGY
ncbi:MAG: hypothetical protein ABI809_05285, partial [Caldimonas sp.]